MIWYSDRDPQTRGPRAKTMAVVYQRATAKLWSPSHLFKKNRNLYVKKVIDTLLEGAPGAYIFCASAGRAFQARMARFRSSPQLYPARLPSLRNTLWQGINQPTG